MTQTYISLICPFHLPAVTLRCIVVSAITLMISDEVVEKIR